MIRFLVLSALLLSTLLPANAQPIADLSAANNRFAVALFHELAKTDAGNLVFSPLSLHTALSMTYAGARGETAKQMSDVLEIESLGDQIHATHHELGNSLRITCNSDTVAKLKIANALWNAACTAKPDYTELLREQYGAEVNKLPLSADSAAWEINSWVDSHTEHRINRLVDPVDLTPGVNFILTNTVYFLGKWEYPFEEKPSQPAPFKLIDGTTIETVTMEQLVRGKFGYVETDDFQALELPYRENSAAMVIFLPKAYDGLRAFETSLSHTDLSHWLTSMRRLADRQGDSAGTAVDLSVPKVETTFSSNLRSALAILGMPMVFESGTADFSGVCGSARTETLRDVLHASFLRIDEYGTEAAAASVVPFPISLPRRRIKFICDHPFFFLIRDTATNTILFMGHIVDPRS